MLSEKDHLNDTSAIRSDKHRPREMFADNPFENSMKKAVTYMNNREKSNIDGHTVTDTEIPAIPRPR